MKFRATLLAFLLLLAIRGIARPDLFYRDDLLKAIEQTGKELAGGKDRRDVLEGLDLAIEANPKSSYLGRAKTLRADLAYSIERRTAPEDELGRGKHRKLELMDTALPLHLITYVGNWPALTRYKDESPKDPMVPVLHANRSIIQSLLPALTDRSPTRSYLAGLDRGVARIPRVCDLALLAIEFHAKCRFRSNSLTGLLFHELSLEDRNKTARHIEKWWAENKEKPVAAGIRAQLPHGDVYAQIWMAQQLARLGDKGEGGDRKYALDLLTTIVRKYRGIPAVNAARALANFGDFASVDVFYSRWKDGLKDSTGSSDRYVVFYLTDYGTRREWELLHELAEKEIEQGLDVGAARIWPALVNCGKARTSFFAIPSLALALSRTRISGCRSLEGVGSQPFSYADTAAEKLQMLTKEDFGYLPGGSPEERAAAIRKAQQWWNDEGSKRYTFDRIEALLRETANESLHGTT